MPNKAAPKDARKRTKKPGKIADLPAKSLKGEDAAKVKAGGALVMQTISTISKAAHDDAMEIIRNLKA